LPNIVKRFVLAAVVLSPNSLSAKPGPFHGYRVVEPTGRFYAVVKPIEPKTAVGRFGIAVDIWLAQRRSDAGEAHLDLKQANPDRIFG
jgi:hypothetical protein